MNHIPKNQYVHWQTMFEYKYMRAADLAIGHNQFRSLDVKILNIVNEEIKNARGKKVMPVLYLDKCKPLWIGKANAKLLENALKTDDLNAWIGRDITLIVQDVKNPEGSPKFIKGVRVSTTLPTPGQTDIRRQLVTDSQDWINVVSALVNGQCTIDYVRTKFFLTPDQDVKLLQSCP